MTIALLNSLAANLLELMTLLLVFSLLFRYLAFRHSRLDYLFFSTFSREVDRKVQNDRKSKLMIEDVDEYLSSLLKKVSTVLPKRKIRTSKRESQGLQRQFPGREKVSLKDYTTGEQSLISGILEETSSFQSSHPPHFMELTMRLMSRDRHWTKLFKVIPIDRFSRVLDILPGIFIVLGIFGTFVGISQALPEISKIDPQDVEGSGAILSKFVLRVTYALDTSIFGIVASLVLTFINALFPITETRNIILKRVSNSLERLWYFVQTSADESRFSDSQIFPKILNCLERIESNTNTKTTQGSNAA